jgi:hypothetical protein
MMVSWDLRSAFSISSRSTDAAQKCTLPIQVCRSNTATEAKPETSPMAHGSTNEEHQAFARDRRAVSWRVPC